MTDDRSLDRAARSWLEEGPTRAPDRPVKAALARIQTTSQERGLALPWRTPRMLPRLAAAAAVTALAVGGIFAAGALNNQPPPSAAASPTPTAAAGVELPCASKLLPGLLLTAGCTYISTEFQYPFTVEGDGRWLTGGEFATGVSFTWNAAGTSGASIELIVLGAVDAPISCEGGTPPSLPSTPISAGEYLAWLDTIAGETLARQPTTFGGLAATGVNLTARDNECAPGGYPGSVGRSSEGANGEIFEANCFGSCTIYVLYDGDQLLVATVSLAGPDVTEPGPEVAAFLDGLRFAP